MTAHPRREFLLRVLAACGTPLLAPVVSAKADQTPQAEPVPDPNARVAAATSAPAQMQRGRLEKPTCVSSTSSRPGRPSSSTQAARCRYSERRPMKRRPSRRSSARFAAIFRKGVSSCSRDGWCPGPKCELCALTLLPPFKTHVSIIRRLRQPRSRCGCAVCSIIVEACAPPARPAVPDVRLRRANSATPHSLRLPYWPRPAVLQSNLDLLSSCRSSSPSVQVRVLRQAERRSRSAELVSRRARPSRLVASRLPT